MEIKSSKRHAQHGPLGERRIPFTTIDEVSINCVVLGMISKIKQRILILYTDGAFQCISWHIPLWETWVHHSMCQTMVLVSVYNVL